MSSDDNRYRWSILGVGGALSLCCLFAAPAATGTAGGAVAGGTTAALGGSLVQIFAAALAVGVLALGYRLRSA